MKGSLQGSLFVYTYGIIAILGGLLLITYKGTNANPGNL